MDVSFRACASSSSSCAERLPNGKLSDGIGPISDRVAGERGPKERDVKNHVHTRFTLFYAEMPIRIPPGFLYSPTAILADSNL